MAAKFISHPGWAETKEWAGEPVTDDNRLITVQEYKEDPNPHWSRKTMSFKEAVSLFPAGFCYEDAVVYPLTVRGGGDA